MTPKQQDAMQALRELLGDANEVFGVNWGVRKSVARAQHAVAEMDKDDRLSAALREEKEVLGSTCEQCKARAEAWATRRTIAIGLGLVELNQGVQRNGNGVTANGRQTI